MQWKEIGPEHMPRQAGFSRRVCDAKKILKMKDWFETRKAVTKTFRPKMERVPPPSYFKGGDRLDRISLLRHWRERLENAAHPLEVVEHKLRRLAVRAEIPIDSRVFLWGHRRRRHCDGYLYVWHPLVPDLSRAESELIAALTRLASRQADVALMACREPLTYRLCR